MKRVGLLVKGFAVAAITGTILYGECLPLVNGTFDTNGIVVGTVLAGGGSPPGGCAADAGWGGVTENVFAPVNGGMPDTHKSRMFFVATPSGPNIDRMYVGIHVENDDGFSSNDILTLYVDANNNGSFDAADFAFKIEMGPATPPTTEDCKKPAAITYYRFSGGNWVVTALPANGAIAMTSFDYNAEMPDPETGIWEMELEIRPTTLGAAMPIATGARIGAKLYVDEPGIGVRVLAFPSNLTTNDDPNATSPNDGAVTAASLATLTIGTCGFDVTIESISSTDHLGNPNKFTRNYPNPISGTVPDNQRSKFNAQVRFRNPANAGDTSPVAVPNAGTITFRGMPWNAGDFTGNFVLGTPGVQFTALGQVKNVQISWPANEAQYGPARASLDLNPVNHVCLKVSLSGFTVNLNEATDVMQQNLQLTKLSTVRDSFLLGSARTEGVGGGNLYYLRARWANVPASRTNKDPARPRRGLWNYRFINAARIGLRSLGNGWYRIQLRPNQTTRVSVEMTGGTMPYPIQAFVVSPRAGGQSASPPSGDKPVTVAVKPGMGVTIVAEGLISVDRAPIAAIAGRGRANRRVYSTNGPDGFVAREPRGEYLLNSRSAYTGAEHVGALIGSFDGFKTAFRIGGSSSFMVPDGATTLSLAVNDVAGQYGDNSGAGFSVTAVLTPPMFLPTRLSSPGNVNNGMPAGAEVGVNLPRLNIDVLRFDERRKLLRPAGYVSYAVYMSHP